MPPIKFFLDTHILIWWLEGLSGLTAGQRQVLDQFDLHRPFGVSDITLAEIGCLHAGGRISLSGELGDWLARATAEPLVKLCRITPTVVSEISRLPDTMPRDPSDRIIVATARVHGATLLTRDRRILASGALPTLY